MSEKHISTEGLTPLSLQAVIYMKAAAAVEAALKEAERSVGDVYKIVRESYKETLKSYGMVGIVTDINEFFPAFLNSLRNEGKIEETSYRTLRWLKK